METSWSFRGDLEADFSSQAPSPVDSMGIFLYSEAEWPDWKLVIRVVPTSQE